jgi:hypothetical protein
MRDFNWISCIFLIYTNDTGQNCSIKIANKSLQVWQCSDSWEWQQQTKHEEIQSRCSLGWLVPLSSELMASCFWPTSTRNENMQKKITFPAVLYGQKIGFLPQSKTQVEGIWEYGAKETTVFGPMREVTQWYRKFIRGISQLLLSSKYYQGEEIEDDVIWGIRSTHRRDAKYKFFIKVPEKTKPLRGPWCKYEDHIKMDI